MVSAICVVFTNCLAIEPGTLDTCVVQSPNLLWAVGEPESTLTWDNTGGNLTATLGREPCQAHPDCRREGTLNRVELLSEGAAARRGLITRKSLVPWTGLRAGESSPRYLKAKPRHLSLGSVSSDRLVDQTTPAQFPGIRRLQLVDQFAGLVTA